MSELGDDWREYRQQKQNIRNQRAERFETEILPKIKCEVYKGSNDQWVLDTNIGIIDYYPKSDKLLFREGNNWVKNGMQWIKLNLLK